MFFLRILTIRCYCCVTVEHLPSELEVVGSNPKDCNYVFGSVGIEFFLGFHFSLFQKFCFIS